MFYFEFMITMVLSLSCCTYGKMRIKNEVGGGTAVSATQPFIKTVVFMKEAKTIGEKKDIRMITENNC